MHTAFNFFYEAGIGKGNIQEMLPQGALIRIMQKGLEYIELEANSEIGSDEEHHFFESLDLMTNDLDDLTKKITSSGKHSSEKKIDLVETDKAQNIGSAETTTTYKAAQNSKPDETATMVRTQPVKHTKAQNISSAETMQKTGSVETTTGPGLPVSWIGKKSRPRRRKD